jgi:hypothetical protein
VVIRLVFSNIIQSDKRKKKVSSTIVEFGSKLSRHQISHTWIEKVYNMSTNVGSIMHSFLVYLFTIAPIFYANFENIKVLGISYFIVVGLEK